MSKFDSLLRVCSNLFPDYGTTLKKKPGQSPVRRVAAEILVISI